MHWNNSGRNPSPCTKTCPERLPQSACRPTCKRFKIYEAGRMEKYKARANAVHINDQEKSRRQIARTYAPISVRVNRAREEKEKNRDYYNQNQNKKLWKQANEEEK